MSGIKKGEVFKEGYLTKKAIVSGRNWKKRYFILKNDGSLSYAAEKGQPPKNVIMLGAQSKALASKEEGETELGFTVEGPNHDVITVRADTAKEAAEWLHGINVLIKQNTAAEDARRHNTLEAYASTNKLRLLGGRKSQTSKGKKSAVGSQGPASPNASSASSPTSPGGRKVEMTKEIGWVMRVGEKDCFVEARTLQYYADKQAFDDGDAALGKATLTMLV